MSQKCLTNVNPKGKDLDAEGSVRVPIIIGTSDLEKIESFRTEVRKRLKIKLTKAHIFRVGAQMFMSQVSKDLRKAQKGAYHAKKRKDIL